MSCRDYIPPIIGCDGKPIQEPIQLGSDQVCQDRSMVPVKYIFRKDGFNKIQELPKPKKKGRKWAKKA